MGLLSGVSNFFGLDIGTDAIRAVELRGNALPKTLVRYAYVPIDPRMAQSDAKSDEQKILQVIKNLLSQAKMSTRNVAVNLPSKNVFTTVAEFDRLNPGEMGEALHFQAESLIPTPIAESKIDWAQIGDSPKDKTKVEILLSSVPNKFVEQRLDMLESIGLNVIAFEPSNMAMTRALVPAGATLPHLVLDIGRNNTDLVIVGEAPHLTRVIPIGTDTILHSAAQNLNVDDKQAQQLVFKFGLSKQKLEGQVLEAIISTVDNLVGEVDKSLKFFMTRYPESKIDRLIVSGLAASIPEFPLYLANKFGLNTEIGNAWRNVAYAPERQNELLTISSEFAVAVGLAERKE
ncbi:MAG: type IV pilus assembly protein PilM [Candidatus Saccharimonadales bacterium]